MIIRAFQPWDLGHAVQLWERAGSLSLDGAGPPAKDTVDLLSSDDVIALVAELDGEIVGMVLGTVSGAVGRIYRLVVSSDKAEVADELLEQLEPRLAERGAHKLASIVRDGEELRNLLERHGYQLLDEMRYLERGLPEFSAPPTALAEVGGQMIHRSLWDELKGMEEVKEIIERRIILPLSKPDLASRHGVSPPRAIVLFGPPGTGKTTFAKSIASRLMWPFIELQTAEFSGQGSQRQARLLAETLDRILEMPAAVVFVDEVDDLASLRHEGQRIDPRVKNEFLKQIPRMRETGHHLLVCATNFVRQLDPAFLRPGRFDYVVPVGPPDYAARTPMWKHYVQEITDEDIDLDTLVTMTELFTPADIEFAARKAAQRAFEREHFEGVRRCATTADFLTGIEETKPTLSEEMVTGFDEDMEQFARY